MIESLATAMALGAEFLKTREEHKERVDSEDFRQWLQSEVFPKLLADADQTIKTLISLKAAEHDRYSRLVRLLEEIHSAVIGSPATQRWAKLTDLDRQLLTRLYESCRDQGEIDYMDPKEEASRLETTTAELLRSARHAKEHRWLVLKEYTGGWSFSATSAGVLFAWEVLDADFAHRAASIAQHLPQGSEVGSLGEIARSADVPFGLVHAQLEVWSESELLDLTPMDSLAHTRVFNVSETLRRQYART